MSHCANVQVIFSQGAKLHSFPNKLPRYILQEEWKVFRNIVVFCNIQKHNFFYFLARIEYMKESSNTGVRHKENDKAVHHPFQVQEGVQAFWWFLVSSQFFFGFQTNVEINRFTLTFICTECSSDKTTSLMSHYF